MDRSAIRQILIIILFLVSGLLIYSNTYDVPFYFDDLKRIQNNPHLRLTELNFKDIRTASFNKHSSSRRPVGNLSFALNYYFHEYRLAGYHAVNIAIHILTGIFLYLFLKITMIGHGYAMGNEAAYNKNHNIKNIWNPENKPYGSFSKVAFFSSLIWLVHPLHTQSVTYIVQRMNSMAAMFFILSFYLYIKGRITQQMRRTSVSQGQDLKEQSLFSSKLQYLWFSGSVITWILALGSKQTTATLPFFILLYEWYFFQGANKDWLKRSLKYILAILILFSVIALIYLGLNPLEKISSLNDFANREFTFSQRLLTQPRVIIYYLSLLFYPRSARLNIDYDFSLSSSLFTPLTTVFSLMLIAALLVTAVFLARKDRLMSFCIFWFLGNLVIESVIPLAIIFEHRTYLPSMLLFLVPVILVFRYIKFRKLIFIILCAVAVLSSLWTYERNETWRDPVDLWSDCVKKSQGKARPHDNLGFALAGSGFEKKAMEHYLKAIELEPDYVFAYNNMGNILHKQGNTEDAINYFLAALRLNPDFTATYNNLGNALKQQGMLQDAISYYQKALQVEANPTSHYNLAKTFADQGRFDEALQHYYKALQITPNYAKAHFGIGNALTSMGDVNEAIKHYNEALRINPDYSEGYSNLGIILASQGNLEEAIRYYAKALRLKPENPETLNSMGAVLAQQGRFEDSIYYFKKALQVKPNYKSAQQNLEIVSKQMGLTSK